MKADISTLHKPDILILQRSLSFSFVIPVESTMIPERK